MDQVMSLSRAEGPQRLKMSMCGPCQILSDVDVQVAEGVFVNSQRSVVHSLPPL